VHLLELPFIPEGWKNEALASQWASIRDRRRHVTSRIEDWRREGKIGSSLQVKVILNDTRNEHFLLSEKEWEEVLIVSNVKVTLKSKLPFEPTEIELAPGTKCDRCWRVLPEVGECSSHPTLCRRCDAVVEAL
jgi:isoleucyl-tRNA synthetase